jgi:subtilase family serine protease
VDAYNDPDAQADVSDYRSHYGLPATTITVLNESGAASPLPANAGTSGWDVEESLDLDMVSAICPKCHIDLLEAQSTSMADLATAAQTAAGLPGVVAVSNSYGGSEFAGETEYDSDYDHPGVAMTVSAGDSGYGVQYPAASPWVTAVGGTSLEPSSSARGWTETAWGDGAEGADGNGTGSGCSAYEPKPSWQGTVSDPDCSQRTVADVAADADPATGVCIYDSYSLSGLECGWGGTSAASPIIAATYALAGPPAAGSYPASYPYAHPTDLNHVTSGSNGNCGTYLCNGGTGYNGPTGLGTPDGLLAFMNADDAVTVTNPGQQTATQGKAIKALTISASDSASFPLSYSASGLPPGLSISPSSGIIGGKPAKGGTFTVTVTATDTDGASGSTRFAWVVKADKLTISNPGRPSGRVGQTVSLRLHATSSTGAAVRFTTATGLPRGLLLTPLGQVRGKLTRAGTYVCTVRAHDADGTTASVKFTWVVRKA